MGLRRYSHHAPPPPYASAIPGYPARDADFLMALKDAVCQWPHMSSNQASGPDALAGRRRPGSGEAGGGLRD